MDNECRKTDVGYSGYGIDSSVQFVRLHMHGRTDSADCIQMLTNQGTLIVTESADDKNSVLQMCCGGQ